MKNENVIKFGSINSIEGYSYLALVFIAMPMKYLFAVPMAVKVVGMIHGILFILFCYYLVKAWQEAEWSVGDSTLFFIASLIPFGTFFTKKSIASYELKSSI
ncbi:MAG: DUF3817 domain-containing protein [Sulfurimonas sp.]|uniref:DUF3817 domain-containing protein n=1 Tax=Sulfurimonas sp. TaxID=2022749 RepID=UPI0026310750|nr:DUF3817 domain-containing protein [Sulfurimonas sp.]MDD2652731.1 DUF3817 domain-containing protein [Sulfurimonas sp.]MDD3450635.1 DUF3817 domain-containing protein [Sulfurimonas sp.]